LHTISRRELLGSLAALGAGTLAPARAAVKKGRIDVHHHITPGAGGAVTLAAFTCSKVAPL